MKQLITNFTGAVSVAVAGCGGTGSQMLVALARLNQAMTVLGGCRLSVNCYDPDTVSAANCARQAFYDCDIGQNKAHVLAKRLGICFPGFKISGFAEKYDGHHRTDILISCVDSRAARRSVSEKRNTRYHIDCGNGPDYGQVLLGCGSKLLPWPETAEPDLVADVPEDDAPSCSMAEALEKQELFVNDFAVRIASAILWDMFRHGGTDVQGAYYTTSPVRITPVMIKDLRSKK